MKKVIKYIFLTIAWLIAGVVFLVLLVALLLQTDFGKGKVASIAENQAESFLNGQLQIGKIDGNFFSHLELEDVLLTFENDTMAFIDSISLDYNLWPLTNSQLEINSARISEPFVYLEQYSDSVWNFEKIMKPVPESPDTATTGSQMAIDINSFILRNGNIRINAIDTVIPRRIGDINTRLSMKINDEGQRGNIENFSFYTTQPDFTLNKLQLELLHDSNLVEVNNLVLQTAQNQLSGSARVDLGTPREGTAHIETEPLVLQEFEYFIPGFRLPAHPEINLDARMIRDSVQVDLDLKDNNQTILLNLKSGNLVKYIMDTTNVILDYQLAGELNNIMLSHWTGNPEMDYLVNGQLNIDGRGIDPETAYIALDANLNQTVVEGRRLDELIANITLNNGNLDGILRGSGTFGRFKVEPNVRDLLGSPTYYAELSTSGLNLAPLTGIDTLNTNLNIQASVRGRNFEPEKINASATVKISDSRFRDIQIDTMIARAEYRRETAFVDTLLLKTQSALLTAHGVYSMNSLSDMQLSLTFDSLSEFSAYIPVDSLYTSGTIDARLQGTPDLLHLEALAHLGKTSYATQVSADSINLDAEGELTATDTLFDADIFVHNIVAGDFVVDSLTANVSGTTDSIYVVTDVTTQEINTHLETAVVPGTQLKLAVNDWKINYKDYQWELQQSPAVFRIDSVTYEIENFKMASGNTDSASYIAANGIITRNGNEDFELTASGINIEKLMNALELDFKAEGLINLDLNINGTALSPVVKANFSVEDAVMNTYKFDTLAGNLKYQNENLDFEANIIPEISGRIHASGELPLQLNLDTMGYVLNEEAPINAQVKIDSFALAVLETFDFPGEIKGYVEGDVNVKGTLKEPDPNGRIHLEDASIAISQFGVNYNEVKLNIEFLKNSVSLDTLLVRSEDGYLKGTGSINFSSEFYEGDISQSKIQLDFNEFNLLNHDQLNLQLTGNAHLSGEEGNVVFGGDVKIPQAEIYIPTIMSMLGEVSEPEMAKPILIKEIQRMEVSADSFNVRTFEPITPDSTTMTYFDDLRGSLRIRIPKNTWIKNPDMRVEISGEVELIKEEEYFQLFGSVEVVRGQYELLGKTFIIEDGVITFRGGEEIMPHLNIEATYSFRTPQRVEQELTVIITGTVEKPEIEFRMDGTSINEGDALSYILFGKSMNELTMNEQQGMASAGGAGSLAEKAAASVLSSQITGFLSDKLNVDYIEVKSEGSFETASLVVGKYLTNDLFVSYEQRFGETDDKELDKYEVTLEYEVFPFLFLELNNSTTDSGFDVIVKFDVK